MAIRKSDIEAGLKKYLLKRTPRLYHWPILKWSEGKPRCGFILDPRLGKTFIAIARAGNLWRQKRIRRWLIICPSIAKPVWEQQLQLTTTMPYRVTIVEGPADERKASVRVKNLPAGKLDILIVNHEATWRIRRWILRWVEGHPCYVTMDESQKIKKSATKQSRMGLSIARKQNGEDRDILTGTLMNTPEDVFGQFRFLDETIFGTKLKRSRKYDPEGEDGFLDRYVARWGFGGFKPAKWHNLDELNEKIAEVCYFLTREQAGGFPKEQDQEWPVTLTNPAARHYDEMTKELKTMVRDREVIARIVLTQTLRLQQITGGFLPLSAARLEDIEDKPENVPLGRDKLKALEGVVEEYPKDEPLVIFARFRYEMAAIIEALEKMGRPTGIIAGARGKSLKERELTRQRYVDGKLASVVVQIKAGIAIELPARTGIFYSMNSSWIDYQQCRARIITQTGGSVAFVHLLARGTIDEDIYEAVQTREDLVKIICRNHGQT